MEKHIFFGPPHLRLEGVLSQNDARAGVVITHPHPLYGGSMSNPVVETIAHAYQRNGYRTLRFNFRGTGRSMGSHDNGAGEQDDIRLALSFLAEQGPARVDMAGYSYGTWVGAAIGCGAIGEMVMVSPAVNFLDYDPIGALPCLGLVVVGDADEFARLGRVEACVSRWQPGAELVVIPDTDHFYSGALRDLEHALDAYLNLNRNPSK